MGGYPPAGAADGAGPYLQNAETFVIDPYFGMDRPIGEFANPSKSEKYESHESEPDPRGFRLAAQVEGSCGCETASVTSSNGNRGQASHVRLRNAKWYRRFCNYRSRTRSLVGTRHAGR